MSEPIRLWRGDEETTVNGRNEADALVAQGGAVGPRPVDVEPVKAADVLPAMDEAPTPDPKPDKKRAGEYGSGPGTQRTVDKAKLREVKQERAKDKRAR